MIQIHQRDKACRGRVNRARLELSGLHSFRHAGAPGSLACQQDSKVGPGEIERETDVRPAVHRSYMPGTDTLGQDPLVGCASRPLVSGTRCDGPALAQVP